ncbi:MAG: hypothetical protein WDZ59_15585 [Pirellulales bacterium]
MQCEKFESQLNEVLDRRAMVENEAELVRHARVCDRCGELLAGYETLLDGVELLHVPEINVDLGERVVAELARDRASAGAWRSPAVIGGLFALAAALMLAAVPLALWGPGGGSADQVVERATAADRQPGEPVTALPGNSSLADVPTLAVDRLCYDAGQAMARLPRYADAVLRVDGIRPLTNSVTYAIDSLRSTLTDRPRPAESTDSPADTRASWRRPPVRLTQEVCGIC